ncbi:anti-sigma factor family protein [Streptomyces coeruleoprunus]|uniref:Anti-sigma factor family protein n=1 Tax=Streptomyces coeruleoprunus TaxID=285563 RepID=A0ABV9XBF9_9ACTN
MTKPRIAGLRRLWAECRKKPRHGRLRGAVEAYADGELTGAHRTRVAAHVAGCRACSGSLQTLRLIKASLRGGPGRMPASSRPWRSRRDGDLVGRVKADDTAEHGPSSR